MRRRSPNHAPPVTARLLPHLAGLVLAATAAATLLASTDARSFPDTVLPIVGEVTWLPEVGKNSHSPDSFVGSPSLVQASSSPALWLASHDRFFGEQVGTAYVYASRDLVEWTSVANITSMYWAQLFLNEADNITYIIGTSDDMSGQGNLMIARCLSVPCDGTAWTPATALYTNGTYHCAPTPVVGDGKGRLFRAFDVVNRSSGDLDVVMLVGDASCPDLTRGSCWRMSNAVSYPAGRAGVPPATNGRNWEEPGAIVSAAGDVSVMVRLDGPVESCTTLEECNRAALLHFDPDTLHLRFASIVAFPSSCNKFAVRRSPVDNRFYSLTNPVHHVPVANYGTRSCGQRNTVMLTVSDDLVTWKVCKQVLFDDTGLATSVNDSLLYTGLQYIDFRFQQQDLIAAVRSAYRGAVTYHDANRLLIVRVEGYISACK